MLDNDVHNAQVVDAVDTEDRDYKELDVHGNTGHDSAIGGGLGAVGGAVVGAAAGGPIGAVIGAVVGAVAGGVGVAAVDQIDNDDSPGELGGYEDSAADEPLDDTDLLTGNDNATAPDLGPGVHGTARHVITDEENTVRDSSIR